MIFKGVGDGRPYPAHGCTPADWAALAPRQVRLADLVTTKRTLDLDTLLDEQSTFFGDLFAHVVQWQGVLYLEDGLHRALRTALHGRPVLHARVLDLDDPAWSARLAGAADRGSSADEHALGDVSSARRGTGRASAIPVATGAHRAAHDGRALRRHLRRRAPPARRLHARPADGAAPRRRA